MYLPFVSRRFRARRVERERWRRTRRSRDERPSWLPSFRVYYSRRPRLNRRLYRSVRNAYALQILIWLLQFLQLATIDYYLYNGTRRRLKVKFHMARRGHCSCEFINEQVQSYRNRAKRNSVYSAMEIFVLCCPSLLIRSIWKSCCRNTTML